MRGSSVVWLVALCFGFSPMLQGQLVTSNYRSNMVNSNFVIEFHSQKDRRFTECIYLVQFDTLMPRLELHFSSKRDLEYFNNYLYCFLSECHRDEQPLLFPGFPKIRYDKKQKSYILSGTQTPLFSRRNFVEFVREVRSTNRKNKSHVTPGWQRFKLQF